VRKSRKHLERDALFLGFSSIKLQKWVCRCKTAITSKGFWYPVELDFKIEFSR